MTRVVVRCDASLSIGSGHVIRCRTLGRELKKSGAEVLFLCRRQPGDLIGLLEREFQVLTLPKQQLLPCEGLENRELYSAWLGCSQEQDAQDFIQALLIANLNNFDWLIADHYGLDATWESQVQIGLKKDVPHKLLAIDDLADRNHQADILLDQNFFGESSNQRYQWLVPTQCRQLLGPQYALLGPEYAVLHPLVPSRKDACRVLIFFGGVDKENLTTRALEAFNDPKLDHLSVDVVLGHASPHRKAVAELVAQRNLTTLHDPLPSLAGLIARADLAIGAGGTTSWERACLRLPSLVVTIAANQKSFTEALHNAGHIRLLGDASTVSSSHIRHALKTWVSESLRTNAGWNLTDGFGARRLVLAMLGTKSAISLRPAEADDESLLLHWANDPQVRKNSFSPNLITPSEHHKWFMRGLSNSNRLLLIATTEDNFPIGQIRFDRLPIPANGGAQEAMIDLSIDRCARGHGLAVKVLNLGFLAMKKHWGPRIEAVAEVWTSNAASNACFARANFTEERLSSADASYQGVKRWRKA